MTHYQLTTITPTDTDAGPSMAGISSDVSNLTAQFARNREREGRRSELAAAWEYLSTAPNKTKFPLHATSEMKLVHLDLIKQVKRRRGVTEETYFLRERCPAKIRHYGDAMPYAYGAEIWYQCIPVPTGGARDSHSARAELLFEFLETPRCSGVLTKGHVDIADDTGGTVMNKGAVRCLNRVERNTEYCGRCNLPRLCKQFPEPTIKCNNLYQGLF